MEGSGMDITVSTQMEEAEKMIETLYETLKKAIA